MPLDLRQALSNLVEACHFYWCDPGDPHMEDMLDLALHEAELALVAHELKLQPTM
jgi:hypothetical protein